MPLRILIAFLLLVSALRAQDGIFTDFTISGGVTGTFTCKLQYDKAPVAARAQNQHPLLARANPSAHRPLHP